MRFRTIKRLGLAGLTGLVLSSSYLVYRGGYALGSVSHPNLERYAQQQFSQGNFHLVEDTIKLNSTMQRLYCAQKQNTKYRGALQCDSKQ